MAVGVGKKIDRSELLEIAMGIKKNAFRVDDFDQLIANIDELLDEACKLEREQLLRLQPIEFLRCQLVNLWNLFGILSLYCETIN